MESIRGKVKALSKYGAGFSLVGGGPFYTSRNQADVAGAVPGAEVEFKFTVNENNGKTYHNIKGQVNVVAAASSGGGGASSGGGSRGGGSSTGDQIMRQNALTAASSLYASGAIAAPSDVKELVTGVIQVAGMLAKFSAGEIAIPGLPGAASPAQQAQSAPAPEPQPEPQPEPEPEPAPAVAAPAGSLDEFMNG